MGTTVINEQRSIWFFVKSENPQEFCVTSFSTWWGCLYETFLYILNHLLLLWQCLLDSIRFISSSEEHCSVEIAETAALCNFVIALIYSEFCFNTPTVKYKVEKNNQHKSFFFFCILMYTVCGMCKKISKCSLLLSSKWFLEAAGNGASENAVCGSLLCVVSPPLPNYFSHMVKHLSVSKQSCILSSTTCSLLACSQISSHKIARYVLCYSPSSFLIQDYRIWFH